LHVEAGDLPGVLGGLALGVVEVRGDRDHRVGDRLAQVLLGVALELAQDARGDLLRRVLLVVDVDGPVGAHVALDRRDGAVDVRHRLTLGDLAHQDLAGLGERDHRRGGPRALRVGDDGGLATLEDGHHGVRGTEVDSYCACHVACFPRLLERVRLSLLHSTLGRPLGRGKLVGRKLRPSHSTPATAETFPDAAGVTIVAACPSRPGWPTTSCSASSPRTTRSPSPTPTPATASTWNRGTRPGRRSSSPSSGTRTGCGCRCSPTPTAPPCTPCWSRPTARSSAGSTSPTSCAARSRAGTSATGSTRATPAGASGPRRCWRWQSTHATRSACTACRPRPSRTTWPRRGCWPGPASRRSATRRATSRSPGHGRTTSCSS